MDEADALRFNLIGLAGLDMMAACQLETGCECMRSFPPLLLVILRCLRATLLNGNGATCPNLTTLKGKELIEILYILLLMR